ncbi:mitochondrial dimethyladenosine transferase 1-like [Vespa mandarinia]|uniref:mitochondrial dimethyladenosine transferase 1-like n=1 Tax=Vespa mandarinia TaxID=7446 RepID=UPI001616F7ED|nr:mitochondrial dimethyladenosine transferase 1-like [Vespa mandarinia]
MLSIRLPPFPTIKDIIKLYKLSALKHLSQNFLLDERLIDNIIKKAGNLNGSHVVEIGPGPGGLTRSIIRKGPKKLIVVEKDKRFKPILDMLAESFYHVNGQMDIIYEDIRNLRMNDIFPMEEKKEWMDNTPNIHLIGNLPFNVSTILIIEWLKNISEHNGPWTYGRAKMLLTFQKEVAERLVAEPFDKQRCRLSVMAQAWTQPRLCTIIPGKAFLPKPDVDVGVVTFEPLKEPRTKHEFNIFEKVTRHIFNSRQKYSIKCVKKLFPEYCREELSNLVYKLTDLDPMIIPTKLTVEDIDKITTAYKYIIEKHPEISSYDHRASHRILNKKYTEILSVNDIIE